MAASGKLYQHKAFMLAVADFQLLPLPFVKVVAAALPGTELLAGGVLVIGALAACRRPRGPVGLYTKAAAWIAAGLMTVFIAALVINLLRGLEMDCACFDVLGSYLGEYVPFLKSSRITWWTVARDVVMLALAYPILVRRAR